MKKNHLITFCGLLMFSTFGLTQGRTALIETYTSSTCTPCAPGNENLESILSEPSNEGQFVSIKYQMYWPGAGDPYYTDECDSRRLYYGVSSLPETHMNGGSGFSPSALTQPMLDGAIAETPKCEITAFFKVDEASQTVDIMVDVLALEDIPGGTFLQCAIYEKTTTGNLGSNGETEFFNVMKKFVPAANGTIVPSSIDSGDVASFELSYTFEGDYTLPTDASTPIDHSTEHSVEEFSDLGVAVWVQRIASKEVFNAADAQYTWLGMEESNSSITSITIYPNPTIDRSAIVFHAADSKAVTITLTNSLGQQVFIDDLETVSTGRNVYELTTEAFEKGIYLLTISSENGKQTKRLSIR